MLAMARLRAGRKVRTLLMMSVIGLNSPGSRKSSPKTNSAGVWSISPFTVALKVRRMIGRASNQLVGCGCARIASFSRLWNLSTVEFDCGW